MNAKISSINNQTRVKTNKKSIKITKRVLFVLQEKREKREKRENPTFAFAPNRDPLLPGNEMPLGGGWGS